MPLTYTDLLPATACAHRHPRLAEHRASARLDLCWLSPEPLRNWSTAGRRTTTTASTPAATRAARSRDRWRLFNDQLDQEIRLAARTGGDAGPGVQVIIALNHGPVAGSRACPAPPWAA